jgi:rubrerythrin
MMTKRRLKAVDALKLAIEREQGAGTFYSEAARTVTDPGGRALLNWLVEEESRHLDQLRQQLSSLQEGSQWIEWRRAGAPIEKTEIPSSSEATGAVSANASDEAIVRQAIGFERDAISLYQEAEESTPDLGGKSVFGLLAEEEKGHLALLEGELEWITKYGKYFTLGRFGPS